MFAVTMRSTPKIYVHHRPTITKQTKNFVRATSIESIYGSAYNSIATTNIGNYN